MPANPATLDPAGAEQPAPPEALGEIVTTASVVKTENKSDGTLRTSDSRSGRAQLVRKELL